MVCYSEELGNFVKGLELKDICINIICELKEFTLCFIEKETEDCLIIAETCGDGKERLRIINKSSIHYIELVYKDEIALSGSIEENVMFH